MAIRPDYPFSERLKRGLDIAASSVGILLFAPIALLIAIAIKVEDGGPVFYRQKRVGRCGVTFTFWKFRSMYVDADKRKASLEHQNKDDTGVLFKIENDPRITRVGRILRKLSLDEMPQLLNVLKGDMSIVGPRPALPGEVSKYNSRDAQRLLAPQGLTCLWQVNGRSDLDFKQQVDLDLAYMKTWSLWQDIKLILRTFPAVLSARGAY